MKKIKRLKSLITEETTKKLDAEKRLSEWEGELDAQIKEMKESALVEYKNSFKYQGLKVSLSIKAYMAGQESFQERVEVRHLEWDLSFLHEEANMFEIPVLDDSDASTTNAFIIAPIDILIDSPY